uniref:Uncharacterized protein n=1 Tax=Peronospora matthiolae TaxID=2874970 RepID=A0AAV1TAM4_9STRA
MVDHDINTVASSVYDPLPATPSARDNKRVAPNFSVKQRSATHPTQAHHLQAVQGVKEEVPSPLAQLVVDEPASGVLHNTLDEDQAQYLQLVDDRRRQAQCVATAYAHSSYRFTQPSLYERICQTSGQSLATWVTGHKANTTTELAESEALRETYWRVERMTVLDNLDRMNQQALGASVSAMRTVPVSHIAW